MSQKKHTLQPLYLASGNAHKVAEFQSLALAAQAPGRALGNAGLAIEIISARAIGGMPPVVEDTGTFVGNARKKALALRAKLPGEAWVLADDSGVCVDALGGAPGVESAYYAGPEGDSAANLRKLVEVMRGVPEAQRGAAFVCVLALVGPGEEVRTFEGRCTGKLLPEPRGAGGFGYDPLFLPDGYRHSYAELSEATKNHLSHRGQAWSRLTEWWARTFTK